MSNLPIFRAKSNERKNIYVEGLLIGVDDELNLCTIRTKDDYMGGEICYLDTLSINFPGMIDSQGNKIFASLQEDGKGGDILGNVRIKFCQEDFIFKIQPIGYNYWNKINSSIFYFFEHSIIKGIQE